MCSSQTFQAYLSLLIVIFVGYSGAEAPTTLRLAHVVFRHGDRSPTQTFPKDPHQADAWPQGFGQLTQLGMRQEYQLGRVLRSIYNGFLNETYIRLEISVRSTDKDRTLMSAYTCLAGLYPPQGKQVWNESLKWQPIPVHTVNYATDNLLRAGTPCPRYNPMMDAAFNSEEALNYSTTNKEFLADVRRYTGLDNASLYDVMEMVPNPLLCEKIHNMSIPDWVTPEVFDKLQDMKALQLKFWFYTEEMQRIRGGVLLKEIRDHIRSKVNGELHPMMKMYLYSAHDTTLAAVLMGLKTWDGLLPAYATEMAFELHQRADNSYFVKLQYKNDTTTNPNSPPISLSIRGCELECDVDKFFRIIQPVVYEGDWFEECADVDPSSASTKIPTGY